MKRLLLVGGGHAHLFVLEAFAREPMPGVELTLVTPVRLAPYSGMMPGAIAGHYAYWDACVDLEPIAAAAGCSLRYARVAALDLDARRARCDDGTALDFDLVSLDTGSTPDLSRVSGAAEHAVPVKPIEGFMQRWRELLSGAGGATPRIVIVGGGAAGVEVAFAMKHRLRAAGMTEAVVRMLTDTPRLLAAFPESAARRAERRLRGRGIRTHCDAPAARVDAGAVVTAPGERIDADLVVWATGATAPAWPRDSGLAVDHAGFVRVDACLRSVSHPFVFAAGDLASMDGARRPKSGVYAVRAGPPLAVNLRAALRDESARAWHPQTRSLVLLGCGEPYAIGMWGPLSWEGEWVWRWKDRIDRRFIARFTEPYREA